MPSFSYPSSIRVASEDHALRLKITHNLVHGSPSNAVHNIKGRFPKEFDILWLSDVTISLSGSLDGHQIAAHDIAQSGLVHHLVTWLKANADRLGLNNVSRPFIDDGDGLSKLTLTPSRSLPNASRPHANLVSLHLAYIWRTDNQADDAICRMDPFSPDLFLPAEALLNRVTEQLLINHLVGRYPLIFGPWCKRLDLEVQYFPSIGCSIMEIMARSKSPKFLSKCKRLIKTAHRHHKFIFQSSAAALFSCTDDATSETSERDTDDVPGMPVLTDEEVLCESLERLFRLGAPRRRFKPAETLRFAQDDGDDDLLQCIPAAGIDDEGSWIELAEIAMSPYAVLADSSQTLPEDMDVFAKEDWSEDGMWDLHDADTSVGQREFDAQSDESLISASVPLTSITMRSTQACSLYHHLGVDDHGPDPAASGSCYNPLQLDDLEEPGTWGLFANLIHSPSHGPHDHQNDEQVMQDLGSREAESASFETVDPGCSERGEVEDSDWILSDVEGGTDAPGKTADGADLTEWDLEDALLEM